LQGVWLLIAALGVFFFSSIILYVVYIAMRMGPTAGEVTSALRLPRSFIWSTLFLVGVSGALEVALRAARRDRTDRVKYSLVFASFFAILFMLVQIEGMYVLVRSAAEMGTARKTAYAFTFTLALLHALHVIAGIVGLLVTVFNACRDKYDHERNIGLRFCAIYWHFLDIVWVLLLVAFVIAAGLLKAS
jgi:cytochrome c oxidase subunit 3